MTSEPFADAALLEGVIARVARPDYRRFEAQLRSSGYCAQPIRLRGVVERCDTRGGGVVWSTASEPDGVLRKACGNRREAVCGPCAERYRGDAWQLIAAGLRGGKGVPERVGEHPVVFVTLTAPSFGAVHTRSLGPDGRARPCRPRRDAPTCPHGVPLSCGKVHAEDDPRLGEPICPECFDYAAAVVWNNALSELWRRTTIYLPRALARIAGMTQKALREHVRVSYVKVGEYQRRGLMHFHVVMRLDRAMPKYRADEIKPPPARFGLDSLERAVRAAVADVAAPLPDELGGGHVRWGAELDVRPIGAQAGVDPGRCAGYLAKYATKSTEQAGGPVTRVREDHLDALAIREHPRTMIRRSFELARDPALTERKFGRYAHAFGYRGHCLTKSRRYSTTFKALREARERHVHAQLLKRAHDTSQPELTETATEERIAHWEYVGRGHLTTADAFLARLAAARARENRRLAREEVAEGARAR